MARPRLNRNGLWARIFGKIFGKVVGNRKSRKKIAKNFGKIFQKNCRKFQKNCRNFPKNCRKNCRSLRKLPKTLFLLPINLRATLKVFFAHCLTRSLSHKIILFLFLLSFLPNNSSDLSFRCQKTLNFSERVYLYLSLL